MPYPPPAGPPELGIFQAIGLVPELPTLIGDYFLTNQGGLTVWEPVSGGVLPDMTGHGGEFLTTDGATASWAVVDALPDQATHGGQFLTTDGAIANWADITGSATGLYRNIFDIRNYGAISATTPNDRTVAINDCSPAFEAAIAAWTQQNTGMAFGTNGVVGGIYVPAGNWYISRPIRLPTACTLFGDGPQLSVIVAGPGLTTEPSLVQAFGGPMLSIVGSSTDPRLFPQYGSPLVGGVGQSMVLQPQHNAPPPAFYPPTLVLDHCYPWSTYLTYYAAQISLRCWANITQAWSGGNERWLVGCRSINDDRAIAISAHSNGTTVTYTATLTTAITGKQSITSSAVAADTVVNLEVDYNGSFFDFYLDGVNQGHVAMTGKVYKLAWEQATIGDNFAIITEAFSQPDGFIDSIELSDVARHTGVGGFTPPAAKYAADANTLWLCNFDQPAAPTGWPMVLAQTAVLTINQISDTYVTVPPVGTAQAQPSHGGLVPHYVSIEGWTDGFIPNLAGTTTRDLQLSSRFNNSGIVCLGASRSTFEGLIIFGATAFGLKLSNSTSFYSKGNNIWSAASGMGIMFVGSLWRCQTHGCQIGLWGISGDYYSCADQPEWPSVLSFAWGPSPDNFSTLQVKACSNDEEGLFSYQICAGYAFSLDRASFEGNLWDSSAAPSGTPAFLYKQRPFVPSTHTGDAFACFDPAPAISSVGGVLNTGPINLYDCSRVYGTGWCDIENMVVRHDGQSANNQTGLSVTDVLANNLAGTFTVIAGYTTGGVTFITPEPDGNFVVQVTPKSYEGSAPAAGSTRVASYVTSATGFTVTLEADPGGTCLLKFSYVIIRTERPPLYYDYVPSLPSTVTNPLVTTSPTGDFFVGVTLIPTGGAQAFRFDSSNPLQYIAVAGAGANEWALVLTGGSVYRWSTGGTPVGNPGDYVGNALLSYSSVIVNGKLYGLGNPGPHNIVFGIGHGPPGLSYYAYQTFIDGGYCQAAQYIPGAPQPGHGTQQTPIYIGQDSGGLNTLTTATLRNLKVDTVAKFAVTAEQDVGPQAGFTESAFFGDEFTLGYGAGAAGLGGFATQIAEAKLAGNKYWWLAANISGTAVDALTSFWAQWGTNQALESISVMSGFWDILTGGATGADTWENIRQLCEGSFANTTWAPPTFNGQAWAFYIPPDEIAREANVAYSGATATCVINGTSVTYGVASTPGIVPSLSDTRATVANLVAAINAIPALVSVVTPSDLYDINHINPSLFIQAVALGAAGNGIPLSTDGGGGAVWFPATTGNGINATLTIAGVTFDTPFDTDVDTTVNNTIAQIAADGTTGPLVTGTLVAHQLVVTANTAGAAGNAITISSNSYGGANFPGGAPGHLLGGADGAIGHATTIVVCTLPPFGDSAFYTAGKNTERDAFNTAAIAFAGAHGGDGVVLADVDLTVRDAGDHTKIAAAFLAADNTHFNDAGHAAVVALITPLIP